MNITPLYFLRKSPAHALANVHGGGRSAAYGTWQSMIGLAVGYGRSVLANAASRPLEVSEVLAAMLFLVAAGTLYCQIYCLLALQQMHGATMPVGASVLRAAADLVPSFLAFELGKRLRMTGRPRPWLRLALIFASAILLGVAIRSQVPMSFGLTPRRMAVDRLPFLILAALAIAHYHRRPRSGPPNVLPDRDEPEKIPPARAIDWVKAAGNYVEVHFEHRTVLLRMTLRQMSAALPGRDFVQVHRSVLVNRDRIRSFGGAQRPRLIQLSDGTRVKIGEKYRSNLFDG